MYNLVRSDLISLTVVTGFLSLSAIVINVGTDAAACGPGGAACRLDGAACGLNRGRSESTMVVGLNGLVLYNSSIILRTIGSFVRSMGTFEAFAYFLLDISNESAI